MIFFLSVQRASPVDQLKHIRALDGVRGTAYLLVVGHHCFSTGLPSGPWPAFDQALSVLFSYGYLGVDLFFVLSGFLITSLLLMERAGNHYYRNFYVKRAFRILPVFLVVLGIIRSLGMIDNGYALISLFFVANLSLPLHVDGSQGPFWSLSVEEQFYLLWPVVVRKCSIEMLRRILIATILLEPIARVAMTLNGHSISNYTFTRCDGLAWGALLALTYRNGGAEGLSRWWGARGAGLLVLGLAIFAIAIVFGTHNRWQTTLALTGCPLIFVSIMALVISYPTSSPARFFRLPVLCFFGEISYASYLVHIYVLRAYDHFVGPLRTGSTAGFLMRACACLAVTTAICTASLYFLERPIIAKRRRFLQQSPEGVKPSRVHLGIS